MVQMDDLQTEFADLDLDVTDDDVLAQLAILCNRYNIDATKISCEFFSYATGKKMKQNPPPTLDNLVSFENEKLKNLKVSRRPLDVLEGSENLPDVPELSGDSTGTPTRLVNKSKRHVTPDHPAAKRHVTALGRV